MTTTPERQAVVLEWIEDAVRAARERAEAGEDVSADIDAIAALSSTGAAALPRISVDRKFAIA